MFDLVLGASPVVQAVMILLVMGSIASWAVIWFKLRELRKAESDTEEFVQAYHEQPIDAVYTVARKRSRSPLSVLFLQGYRDLSQVGKLSGGRAQLSTEQLDMILRRLGWAHLLESQRVEGGLSFLATTGSTAPFVGLFGTVIGIMNAFADIGRSGVASLAVVGPGISEALLATAIGLFAAIPAVIGFNYLSARVARLTERLDTFRDDFAQTLRGSISRAA